mgnify:FL=1
MAVNEFGVDLPDIETSIDSTKEIDIQAQIVEAGENTTLTVTITKPKEALGTSQDVTTILTVDKTQEGVDPDTFFADQLDDFEYFERDYIENNPGTVNGTFISYVGGFFDDTTGVSTITTGISTENY